jgi:hypothetical protein
MTISKITFINKETKQKQTFTDVSLFRIYFLNSEFNFEDLFNQLQVRVNESCIYLTSSDAIRICLTTEKQIIEKYNSKIDYSFNITRINLENADSLRNCDFITNDIEIILNNILYTISTHLNKIEISAEESDYIIIQPIASNVISIEGVNK